MKTQSIAGAVLVATIGIASAAFAGDGTDDGPADLQRRGFDQYRQDIPYSRERAEAMEASRERQEAIDQMRRDGYYGYGYAPDTRRNGYGYAQRRYSVGEQVPRELRDRRYWVNDWRERHLNAPPRGHRWVQTETGDTLLVEMDNGRIARAIRAR